MSRFIYSKQFMHALANCLVSFWKLFAFLKRDYDRLSTAVLEIYWYNEKIGVCRMEKYICLQIIAMQ